MLLRKFAAPSIISGLFLCAPTTLLAHHMAPDEMQDFITEQLLEADSPHLLSSDDDPSLKDTMGGGLNDIDYVAVADNLTVNEVTDALEDVLDMLSSADAVCDDAYTIDYDVSTMTYTLEIYVDYCMQ